MAGKKNGVELAKAYVQIIPSMEGVQQNIEDALNGGGGMGDIGSRAGDELGSAFGKAFTAAAGFIKDSLETGMGFDAAMSQVAATMGTTVDKITEMRDTAKEMGAATNYSATQAAEGLNILAMSGYDAEQSMSMLEDVLHLAAAGGMEMSEAAGDISGAMKGFGDASKDSAYYADLMAKGATLANTSVSQLGQALADGSSMGKAYSQSAEDMTVSLLRLAEQGETGSAAATALSAAYANLYTPMDQAKEAMDELGVSAYDSTGATRDFNTVVNELNEAIQRESQGNEAIANQYKDLIFGKQGLNAYNKLVVTSIEKQEEWAAVLKDSTGSAAQQYDTMTDNLAGDMDKMRSAFEGLQIEISEELTDDIRSLVQIATDGLTWATEHSKELIGAIEAIGVAALAMNLPSILGAAKTAMLAFNAACAANPLGAVLSVAAAGVIYLSKQFDSMTEQINEIPDAFEGLDEEQTELVQKISEGTNDLAEAKERLEKVEEQYYAAKDKRTNLENQLAAAQDELLEINKKWVITQEEKLRRQELEREIIPGLTADIKSQNAAVGELGAAYVSMAQGVRDLTEQQELEQQEIAATEAAEQELAEAEQARVKAQEELTEKKEQFAERVKDAMKEALTATIDLNGQTVELNRTTAEEIGSIIDEYDALWEKQKQVIENSFDLFNGFETDTSVTFEQLWNNLNSTSFYMNDWATAIEELGQKNISKDLLDELKGMGADGWKYIYALNHASEPELKKYSDLWQSTHDKIDTTTDRIMADEKKLKEETLASLMDIPEADLEEVRAAFEKAGYASIHGYADGVSGHFDEAEKAIDKLIDKQLEKLESDKTITEFKEMGKNVYLGLAKGMNDPDVTTALDTAVEVIVNRVVRKTEEGFEIKSPSKVFDDMGVYIPEGLAGGVIRGTDSAERAVEYMANSVIDAAQADLMGADFGIDVGVNAYALDRAARSADYAAAGNDNAAPASGAPVTLQIVTPDGRAMAEWLFPDMNELLGKTTTLQARGYA